MTRGNTHHQHPEAGFVLGSPKPEEPTEDEWQFPDPLPVPMPIGMAGRIIEAEIQAIGKDLDDLEYAVNSVRCRMQVVVQTLRDSTGGRAAG